jgi:hypothetical protein
MWMLTAENAIGRTHFSSEVSRAPMMGVPTNPATETTVKERPSRTLEGGSG